MGSVREGEFAEEDVALAGELVDVHRRLTERVGEVIVGQQEVIDQILIALFCQGHCILEGVPGLAKTLLVSSLARLLHLEFRRIQFTPDLMPADIIGAEILEEEHGTGRRTMKFVRGPIFGNILLADELNRTPPKTQAALLQAMQELKVTAAGEDHALEPPFLVLGTQNPIEQEGTYPLPEAQLDRFMFKIFVHYPSFEDEVRLSMETTGVRKPALEPMLDRERILALQEVVRKVIVGRSVAESTVRLVRATRPNESQAAEFVRRYVRWGAGPRASQALLLAGKAKALLEGRYHVSLEDVRYVAKPVLRHRLVTSFAAEADSVEIDELIDELVARAIDGKNSGTRKWGA